jgi:hypothetical protein
MAAFLRRLLRRAENQIGVSDCVIHVPVSQEHHVKIDRQESFNALPVCCSRAPHYAGPEVNQVGRAVDDDSSGWP